MAKKNKTFDKIEEALIKWDDEDILELMGLMLERVSISSHFIQNSDDLVTHQVIVISSGDKMFTSQPQELEWPLQPLPMPEALKKDLN